MAKKPNAADLSNTPKLTQDHVVWLMACVALILVPQALYAPAWLSLTTLTILLWRGFIWFRRTSLPPSWLITLLVIASSVTVYVQYKHFFGKDPGVALLVLFIALKLLEIRTVRDALVVIFLGYFLLLTNFFYAQDMGMAAMVFVALLLNTATMLKLSHAGHSAKVSLRLSGVMLAQATPFMLVVFVLFPRVQGPLWGMPVDAYSGQSGLSDTMSPGSISDLTLSSAIAFRVNFEGAAPAQQQLYWRGPVLSQFDGRSWRPLLHNSSLTSSYASSHQLPYIVTAPRGNNGADFAYTITLEPHNKTWLFALEHPSALPPDSKLTNDYQVLTKDPVRIRQRFDLHSQTNIIAGVDETPTSIDAYRALPSGNPRTRALAQQWRNKVETENQANTEQNKEHSDDEILVRKMLAYFRQEKFFYTLRPPLLGRDSVDDFLFTTQRGFCEHYASSFVFMMRAAGVPARIVTGYQGGEKNSVDSFYVIRQSDAHAWAEVWLPQKGWMRVDPTAAVAPTRIESGLTAAISSDETLPFMMRRDFSWLREMRSQWEAANNSWNQWVLGYNPERQRELLSRLGMSNPDWKSMAVALGMMCGVFMLALMAWVLRQHNRMDPVQRAWNKLSRKLARVDLARYPWEGPTDYARRVAQSRPDIANNMANIVDSYILLRYSHLNNEKHERTERFKLMKQQIEKLTLS